MFLNKYRSKLPKEKNKEDLEKRYDDIELEKGDLPAMLIAALITFGPLIIVISLVYLVIAMFFGL